MFIPHTYPNELENEGCEVFITICYKNIINTFNLGSSKAFISFDYGNEIYRANVESNSEEINRVNNLGGAVVKGKDKHFLAYEVPFSPLPIDLVLPGNSPVTRGIGFPLSNLPSLGGIQDLVSVKPLHSTFLLTEEMDFLVFCPQKTLFRVTKKQIAIKIYQIALESAENGEDFECFCQTVSSKLLTELLNRGNILGLSFVIVFFKNFELKFNTRNTGKFKEKLDESESKFVDSSNVLFTGRINSFYKTNKPKQIGCFGWFCKCFNV